MSKRVKRRIRPRRRISAGLTSGSMLICADNTGAKRLRLIQVIGYKGRKRRYPKAGVGDMIVVSVRDGTPEMRKQVLHAVVIRQRKPYPRRDGTWIRFEDNAAVIVTPEGDPKGSDIRGPVAREAVERWPKLGSIAKMVV
ncbi:50S ribosomal protein L14 [Candidatus Bathyarchaeota archaeon]|nr:50S ribosomal protein L14 [Candidatus Bathyarchaeota archaeon]RLI08696.1 MAG: 50S ribosomal protein L14 [Candidatus Bathyarchaeota archaeon]